jgi:hypothetical protein
LREPEKEMGPKFKFKPSSTVERIQDILKKHSDISSYDPKYKFRGVRALHSSIEVSPLRSAHLH